MLQCSSAFAIRGGQVHYLAEFKGAPDTEQLAIAIRTRFWPNWNNQDHLDFNKKVCNIFVYPDPTGKSRKTSAVVGATDLTILASHGLIVRARGSSPSIVDSVAAVNRMLMTAAGTISIFIDAKLTGLIQSLERTAWVENTSDSATIDKSLGVEHFSDGVRYPMEYLFPIKNASRGNVKGNSF